MHGSDFLGVYGISMDKFAYCIVRFSQELMGVFGIQRNLPLDGSKFPPRVYVIFSGSSDVCLQYGHTFPGTDGSFRDLMTYFPVRWIEIFRLGFLSNDVCFWVG